MATGTTYYGSSESETQDGTADDDTFNFYQGGDDTLRGLGGDDQFNMYDAFTVDDAIDGGTGFDTVFISGGEGEPGSFYYDLNMNASSLTNVEVLRLGYSIDYYITMNDANVAAGQTLTIDGSELGRDDLPDNLYFYGAYETDGNFIVYGGANADTITGGQGHDTIDGNDGNDEIFAWSGGIYSVDAGDGDDEVILDGTVTANFFGGAGSDVLFLESDIFVNASGFDPAAQGFELLSFDDDFINITGDSTGNVIDLTGIQVVVGGGGGGGFRHGHGGGASEFTPEVTIDGGDGGDTISGSAYDETLYGGSGNNTLNGNGGDDFIEGIGVGGDVNSNNIMFGGAGNDLLIGGLGHDTMNGGAGDDSIYANQHGVYTVSGGGGNDTVFFVGTIESPGQINGGGGDGDTLVLRDFVDVETSTFNPGGQGFEAVSLAHGGVFVGGDNHNNTINFSGVTMHGGPNARLTIDGGAGDDTITGSQRADHIFGGPGNNVLNGGGGNDVIEVNEPASHVAGGAGGAQTNAAPHNHNTLDGGSGDDTLIGGAGHDDYIGGSGADTFVFLSADDSQAGIAVRDTVDFHHSQHDKIDLSAIDADTTHAGHQAFHLVTGGQFTGDGGEMIQFTTPNGHTVLAADIDNDGVMDFEIEVTSTVTLTDSDFIF